MPLLCMLVSGIASSGLSDESAIADEGQELKTVLGMSLRKVTSLGSNLASVTSQGHEPSKHLLLGLRFFCIFEESGKNEATDLAVCQLRGSTIAIISAHVPGQHMWASADPGPTTKLTQVLQNSASWMVVLRFTTLSARDRHWRNPRKKNYRERSNIKSARVSALTGSVPRKMAEALQKDSELIKNWTHFARLSATDLNH